MTQTFAKGDAVIHMGKPEWGPGDVLEAHAAHHDGAACQRLTVRFARAGLKTISTAFAELKTAPPDSGAPGLAPSIAAAIAEPAIDPAVALQKIPEQATDPFLPVLTRLRATLSVYKYADSPGGLIDWATVQTGLRDPLSRFSRHDLEQAYTRFQIALDNHLKKLIPEARRAAQAEADKVLSAAGGAAKHALRRVDIRR